MAEMQLQHLNRSRIGALRSGEAYLCLEALEISAKKLRKMRPGDWIDLGEHPPGLEVLRDGRAVATARATQGGVLVTAPKPQEREAAGHKRVLLRGRLTLLTNEAAPGVELSLPAAALERVYLYDPDERLRAVARLVSYEGGYALEILEVPHG